ncbi:hypothetical protein GGI07_001802 [Coemansia sp. Benny D115]|nr:hypothetical protein GGI07_001802 [Coemansia sp. Benny D115]
MNKLIAGVALLASSFGSAYPIYGYYPGYAQSSYHNSGAYDNGVSTSVSPYGANYNSWNNGFSASQNDYASPYGNYGRSSYNQWSSNAYSNSYNNGYGYGYGYGYPRNGWY